MSDLIERFKATHQNITSGEDVSILIPSPLWHEVLAALTPVDDAGISAVCTMMQSWIGECGEEADDINRVILVIERLAREKADINYLWSECNKQRDRLQAELDAHRAALRDYRQAMEDTPEDDCAERTEWFDINYPEHRATIERVQEGKSIE